MAKETGSSGKADQFDDLIVDPEGASEGLGQNSQGYEDSNDRDEGENDQEEHSKGSDPSNSSRSKADSGEEGEIETFDNIDPNSVLKQLDEKEDSTETEKEEEKDQKKEEGKEDKKENKENDEKSLKSEKEDNEQEDKGDNKENSPESGKTLKLFKDGKKYEVPLDASMKVKVNSKGEKVTIAELRDHYSGKQAWDKKFSELDQRDKELTAKNEELTKVQTGIKSTLEDVTTSLKQSLEEGGDPREAINKIVDLLQVDSYDFNRALMDSMTDELDRLYHMDESEREAYWLKKKNEHLQKRHESFEEKLNQSKAQEERLKQVDQMREAHGVSEEDFVSAYEQLSQAGMKDLSHEQVIKYAASVPFVTQAEELLKPYDEQLSDDEMEGMMARIANTLKTNKDVTKEDMAAWLAQHYEVEDYVQQANSKAEKVGGTEETDAETGADVPDQRKVYSSKPEYQSFEDFDDMY